MRSMLVEEIMANYSPLYPPSQKWEDTFKLLRESEHNWVIVQQLKEYLEQYGTFREPVILSVNDEDEEDYVAKVEDGTHRVFAHYLSEYQDVKVQEGWQSDGPSGDDTSGYPVLVVTMQIPCEVASDDDLTENLFDMARSFKVNEDVWFTSDLQSISGCVFYLWWCNYGQDFSDSSIKQVDAHIEGIAQKLGFEAVARSVVLNSEEEMDAFYDAQKECH